MNARTVEALRRNLIEARWRLTNAVTPREMDTAELAEQKAYDAFRDGCDELNGAECSHVECPSDDRTWAL